MSDSRSRRVAQVNVPGPRRNRLAPFAFVGAVAFGALALILAISFVRVNRETIPASSPSPTASAAVAATGASPSAPSASTAVRPDAGHGFFVRSSSELILRTEADPKPLARFPATFEAAATRDGQQVALIRTSQTGQQLIVFAASRPDQQTTLVDFSGSGEFAGKLVWSSDGTKDVLIAVHGKPFPQGSEAVEHSTLRVVDALTGQVREIARTTSGLHFEPIVWHGSSSTAVAIETGPGGVAVNYVLVRGTTVTRTAFAAETLAFSVRADADGQRVLSLGYRAPRSVRWWPFDRFDQQHELRLTPNDDVANALWRPGTDEIAVFVSPMTKGAQPGPRIEVWSLAGQRRVLRELSPLGLMRVDGSAVITTDSVLVDIATGAATPIPGGTIEQMPYLAVKF